MKIYCNSLQQLHIPSHVAKGEGVIPNKHKTKNRENNYNKAKPKSNGMGECKVLE
jgi:hypothetical protein